jgi:hypothetical protein
MTTQRSASGGRTRKPVSRTLRWEATEGYYLGRLTLTVGKEVDAYLVREVEVGADFGRGFAVEHLTDGQSYDVNVTTPANYSTCDCPGHTYRGRCKHCDALISLIARDLI